MRWTLAILLGTWMSLGACAQTSIGSLGRASDAGQRMFDQHVAVQRDTTAMDPDAIYSVVDSMPVYAGGDEAFIRDLAAFADGKRAD